LTEPTVGKGDGGGMPEMTLMLPVSSATVSGQPSPWVLWPHRLEIRRARPLGDRGSPGPRANPSMNPNTAVP
jgi:hypothetical protein